MRPQPRLLNVGIGSDEAMNQNKGGEVTPELLIQQWVDKLKGLGFTDFQLFNNGCDLWGCRGPIQVNMDAMRGGMMQGLVTIELYRFGPACEAIFRGTFEGALNELTEKLEKLEASIPTAKEEIAKLLAEVKE